MRYDSIIAKYLSNNYKETKMCDSQHTAIQDQPSKITMTKRYYLGARSISEGDDNNLCTLGEAIAKAYSAVSNGDEIRYVVEIVRIVRRADRPIIIEETR